jgi:ubiquitin carboxyl-terminal hydrolase 2
MNNKKYKDKGLSGLMNLGNTCFMNSCMQVISHTYELNDFLNLETYQKRLNNKYESVLLVEWNNLRKMLWEKNSTINPSRFVKTVQNISKIKGLELFTGFDQNDLPEFLIFVIDCFHNALARQVNMTIVGKSVNQTDKTAIACFERIKTMYANDYSEIWNMFYGIHVSQLTSLKNKVISMSPEPYFIINLPIPSNNKSPSLIDCFDLYVEPETLDDDILNEKTGKKQKMQKGIKFWSFPAILVIDIKRFSASNKKNQILVDFPLDNLNLSQYVIGYHKDSYIYDLYGICNHSGSSLGGHYTSFVKNANGKWYHYNDTSVVEIAPNMEQQMISPKAYCFFYRKRTL